MDLATENRIALLLMQEATKLRIEAEEEGVHAYLRQPKVRGRPNSRFLTATVLGVQQANKATEVNKMWGVRKKEIELDKKKVDRMRCDKEGYASSKHHGSLRYDKDDKNGVLHRKRRERGKVDCYSDDDDSPRVEQTEFLSSRCKSLPSKSGKHSCSDDGGELGDEEMEAFLHSRVKRGRGDIGSRMDETGPYLPSSSSDPSNKMLDESYLREREEWEQRALGLDKSSILFGMGSGPLHADRGRKVKETDAKRTSKDWQSKDQHRDKKRKERRRGSPGTPINADTKVIKPENTNTSPRPTSGTSLSSTLPVRREAIFKL